MFTWTATDRFSNAATRESTVEFGHLTIAFDDRVLRPRRWTAAQSRWAAELLNDAPMRARLLELCAGVGHIGLLTLALSTLPHRLTAVDVEPVACAFTHQNATANRLAPQLEIREGHVDTSLGRGERFDFILADPPWVPRSRTSCYPEDPVLAIDGGEDGLEVAYSCLTVAEAHLIEQGQMLLQLGSTQQAGHVGAYLRQRKSDLRVVEVRTFDTRGVLVRLARAS